MNKLYLVLAGFVFSLGVGFGMWVKPDPKQLPCPEPVIVQRTEKVIVTETTTASGDKVTTTTTEPQTEIIIPRDLNRLEDRAKTAFRPNTQYKLGIGLSSLSGVTYEDLVVTGGIRVGDTPLWLETTVSPKKQEATLGVSFEF